MPDRHIIPNHTRVLIGHVTNAQVLNVRVMADDHPVDVPAQHASVPHARLIADHDLADHLCAAGHEHIPAELRLFPEVRENAHCD